MLSLESVKVDVSIREFLSHLVGRNMKLSAPNRRLDFLNASPSLHVNGGLMAHQLEMLLNVSGHLSLVYVSLLWTESRGLYVDATRIRCSDDKMTKEVSSLLTGVR